MPEQSKFSGALAKLNQRPAEPASIPATEPAIAPARKRPTEPATAPARGKGRPPGKRSDPDFQPTTVLLRKQTKKTAARQLEDSATGQDLSDLIEQLLTQWINKS